MRQWIWSAEVGIALGVITFLLVFIPVLMLQYRRFGQWNMWRMLGAAAVAIYVVTLMSYTWLPLPPRTIEWCATYGIEKYNLRPFDFWNDVGPVIRSLGLRASLQSTTVLQVLFNVVLFIPWGILVRRFFQRSIAFATVTGLLASLFIELTQGTGLWFIYDCAYRYADVDDLMMNTLGAFIGAVLAPVVLFWMPRTEKIAATRLQARPITAWRRWASMLITMVSVTTAIFVGALLVRFSLIVLDLPLESTLDQMLEAGAAIAAVIMFLYVPAYRGDGDIGLQSVWLAPRWRDAGGTLTIGSVAQRLLRVSVIAIPFLVTQLTSHQIPALILWVTVLLSLALVPFTRNKRSFTFLLTGAEIVDVREQPGGGGDVQH